MSNKSSQTLYVAFDFHKSIFDVDPGKINTLSEATLLRNLYSPLFDYDQNGNLVTGLVKRYEWKGTKLVIELLNAPTNSDGSVIKAEDVVLTLKRLIISGKNLHGDLKEILCPDFNLKSIKEDCPGLYIEENKVVIEPRNSEMAKHLIPMLASVDYRILPKSAIDLELPTLPIKNYDLTSGPFYVHAFTANGKIQLRANKNHYLYSNSMPQEIILEPAKSADAVRLFLEEKVELIPTTTAIREEDLALIEKSKIKFNVEKTYNLRIKTLFFNKTSLEKTSAQQRFAAAKILALEYNKIRLPYESKTIQFFQSFGEGYLTSNQLEEIEKLRKSEYVLDSSIIFSLGVYSSSLDKWKDFFKVKSVFKPQILNTHPVENPIIERPDIFSGVNDVAFNTSLSLISYNLKQGLLGKYGQDANQLISNFMKIENPEERVNFVNKIHYEALRNCAIYPLAATPYIAVIRGNWKLNLNPYFAATQLWQIRKN